MTTRRTFIKVGVATGAGAYVVTKGWSWAFSRTVARFSVAGRNPKIRHASRDPPAMPHASSDANTDYYTIAVRQFRQQILPSAFPRPRCGAMAR